MASGVPNSAQNSETAADNRTVLTGPPPVGIQGVRGGGQPPRDRGVQGGRPPGRRPPPGPALPLRLPDAPRGTPSPRTTSPGFNWFATASSAAAPSGAASASPVQDRTRRAPARIGAASSPTAIRLARSARAANSPTSSWLAREMAPSSAMWPRIANARPPSARWRRACRAARTDSGFALYASLTTVTPSPRRWTSIRHRLRATAAESPSAMSARPRPSSPARAAAARASGTIWAPCSRRVTGARPSGASRVKLARPRSSSRTSTARTEAVRSWTPKVTTRAVVRAAMARTRGSSAFRMATPPAGSASTSSPLAWAT